MHFSGEHFKPLDDKGRLSLPREFREQLAATGNQLILTKNKEGGLTAFPATEWDVFVKCLEGISGCKQRNALNRLYLAPKTEIEFDKQGRIPLSRAQRKQAAHLPRPRTRAGRAYSGERNMPLDVTPLFKHLKINGKELPNRIVMPPMVVLRGPKRA